MGDAAALLPSSDFPASFNFAFLPPSMSDAVLSRGLRRLRAVGELAPLPASVAGAVLEPSHGALLATFYLAPANENVIATLSVSGRIIENELSST